MKYRLDTINDKEFEILAKDLLESELKIKLQNFRSGKDKGVDLRYAGNHENEIIVQAKHYIKSTFSDLRTALRAERDKLEKLSPKPNRYILFTSFDLNTGQTDEIVKMFHPLLKNSQDVFGMSRIQEMIANNSSIEEKHYKLWLTSTNILQRILHNGVKGRSEYVEAKIIRRSRLFVPTEDFSLALKTLVENRVLIITGEPGVGKTTIAHQLIYDNLAKGFELIVADNKLEDAENLLSPDPEKKQVVFFDDFLGANIYEVLNPRNTQTKIVNFIERIQHSPNKLLIMTTRTTILNQAIRHYEKFKKIGTEESLKYEVRIRNYSKVSKAHILYNHIYHALSTNYHDVFFTERFYHQIIGHQNFFPRLIEFITTESQFKNKTAEEAKSFIQRSLDNPSEIWEYAYREQLDEVDQFMLCTIFSFAGSKFTEVELRDAFNSRYDYEILRNGHKRKVDAFEGGLKKLSGGFIIMIWHPGENIRTVNLFNPSIADFLLNYIKNRPDEMDRIFFSARFFEQITGYFKRGGDYFNIPDDRCEDYYKVFRERSQQMLLLGGSKGSKQLTILFVFATQFQKYCSEKEMFDLIAEVDTSNTDIDFTMFSTVLNFVVGFPTIEKLINSEWRQFLALGIQIAGDVDEVAACLKVFEKYGITKDMFEGEKEFMEILASEANLKFQVWIDDIDFGRHKDLVSRDSGYFEYNTGIVEDEINDTFSEFLEACSLSEYRDHLWESIEFDAYRIIDKLVEEWGRDDDDYDRSRTFRSERIENPDDEINNLFDR
ncbi:restriction endonuclease [Chitinophaga sp. 22321]|uniref:AAA family ATPase n=1 Tax=Chitinophaga hostae TaxID=2831022 RepID=A0ABS5JC81_9BACT|nr:restriction endonuclease [Chitinophaga hostae]MBS0032082.1 AAA family ATPase [Chitinophaga hostae]